MADPAEIDELVRDIEALAKPMHWRTWTVAELIAQKQIRDTGLRGLTVSVHPRCEALHFHIDDEGRFVNHVYHACIHHPESRDTFVVAMQHTIGFIPDALKQPGPELEKFLGEGVLHNWTKTQPGGPSAHVQACILLHVVRAVYAPELQVSDDTGFFDHGRIDELESKMGQIEQAIHLAERAMERIGEEGGVPDLRGLLSKLERYMDEELDDMH